MEQQNESNRQKDGLDLALKRAVEEQERSDIFRRSYRDLTSDERDSIMKVKNLARMVNEFLDYLPESREVSLARTKLEECVMWATKSITK